MHCDFTARLGGFACSVKQGKYFVLVMLLCVILFIEKQIFLGSIFKTQITT